MQVKDGKIIKRKTLRNPVAGYLYYDTKRRHFDSLETENAYNFNIGTAQELYPQLTIKECISIVNAYYDGKIERL